MHKTVFSLIIRVEIIFAFPLQKGYLFVLRDICVKILVADFRALFFFSGKYLDTERTVSPKMCRTMSRSDRLLAKV